MTNTDLLKQKIHESGLKQGWLAEKLSLSESALSLKVNGKRYFNQVEIENLRKLLRLSRADAEKIFFAKPVGKTSTN